MADRSTSEDPPTFSNETTRTQSKPENLKFPTIDLNTSLESLLSHSTPTVSEASTIMAAANPPPALDESWASLDVSDFSHDDDDTQSVNTDPGSLVDLSSVHDTESAAEDESQDEHGADEERVASVLKRGASRHSEQVGQPDQPDTSTCDAIEDTIILQQSSIQNSAFDIDMEYVRDTAPSTDRQTMLKETISMTISANDLEPFDTPVRICYYGSPYSPNTKDELLGKIGAALLVPTSNSSSQTSTTSACFNIVPTEFGPGSKPAFADLIPSQTQMSVDELSVVLNPADQQDTLHFALRRGVVIDSILANSPEDKDCKEFRPELLVIHLSEKDFKDRGSQLSGLLEIASRHCWPTIIVADDDSFVPDALDHAPKKYGIQISTKGDAGRGISQSVRPIDIDTFMALDTAQLSRHIMHIMETQYMKESYNDAATQTASSLVGSVRHFFIGARPRRYILKVNEPEADDLLHPSSKHSWIDNVKQAWQAMDGRKHFKDFVFTLIVMMLGIYIVSFSQNLSTKVNGLVGLDNTTSVSTKTDGTATVTATSAIAVTTTSSTAIVANNQDVALYDPVLFDQMWQRLTGRPLVEPEHNDEPAKDVSVEEKVTQQPEVPKKLMSPNAMVDRFTQWLSLKLDAFQTRLEKGKLPRRLKSFEGAYEKRDEVRRLHEKLQEFYKDVTTNVPKLSVSSQKHLHDLVTRSQHLLRETRWAGEKKLRKLLVEQKMLLSQAQHQARHVVSVKKKKRSSFFKRGRGVAP